MNKLSYDITELGKDKYQTLYDIVEQDMMRTNYHVM